MAGESRFAAGAGAGTEMGPALLPTPLSPACGPLPKEACLTPGAWPQTGCGSLARRSRRCRMCLVAGSGREDLSLALRQSASGSVTPATSSGCACAEASTLPSVAGPLVVRPFASGVAPWVALLVFGIALAGASLCPAGFTMCFTFASFASGGLPGFRIGRRSLVRCVRLLRPMSGECRSVPSRASGQRRTYPLLAEWPVDKAG